MFTFKEEAKQKYYTTKIFLFITLFSFYHLFIHYPLKAKNSDLVFTRIGVEQGLAPGNVNDIIQDSLGFIWLGTESGLCRYDGYNFVIYRNEQNSLESLSHNNVFSLLKDEKGIFWVGTLGGGLNKFDSRTGKFIRYQNIQNDEFSLSHNTIYKVFEDSKKRLWISTLGGGLNLFDKESQKFTRFVHSTNSNSISSNMVSAIYEDYEGNIWIGTFDQGINLLDTSTLSFNQLQADLNNKHSINHNQIMDIINFSKDSLLVATFGGGINILNTQTQIFINYQNEADFKLTTEHKNVRKLFDDGVNIWIGSYNGLYRYSRYDSRMEKFLSNQNNIHSLNNNKIREIFLDESKLIWIGTPNGANIYDPTRKDFNFHSFSSKYYEEFGKEKIIPNLFINKNIQWPLSKNLVSKKRKIKFYSKPKYVNDFESKSSINFYYDENNTLWIGDYDGLKYYDKIERQFIYTEVFNSDPSDPGTNFVKSFFIDSRGDFWAGTLGGGLTHLEKTTLAIKRYVHIDEDDNSISDSRVLPIYEDSYGIMWIGTYGGLNKFHVVDETFTHYNNQPDDSTSISNDRIFSIFESNNDNLWVGTYQGLNKFIREDDSFRRITVENGLVDNTIYSILEDDQENLWLRTNKGFSKFNPITNEIKNYSSSDRFGGLESNGNICFKTKSGKLFFGSVNGFYSFYPESIKDNLFIPEIAFTELKILDKKINVGDNNYFKKTLNDADELNLSYLDRAFTIEFSALHYTMPSKNKYAYMLENFRDKWSYVDSDKRIASFTNLSPGEYNLHVKGSNSDGIWNESGRSLKISISPPYWETWWFRLMAILLVLFIVFLVYEFRLQRLLEIERTRARIARNLHDDVGGTLASIQYFVDGIRKSIDRKKIDKFLDLIMDSSNDAKEKIRDIIWTVNPKEDGLTKFFIKFKRYASDLLDTHEIEYEIDLPKIETERKIEMEKRQHLWCICKETVTNIIKHSKCAHVKISFSLSGNTLLYYIEDDGVGFNKDQNKSGNGFNNIEFRANKLNASYKYDTAENNGLRIQLSFQI